MMRADRMDEPRTHAIDCLIVFDESNREFCEEGIDEVWCCVEIGELWCVDINKSKSCLIIGIGLVFFTAYHPEYGKQM